MNNTISNAMLVVTSALLIYNTYTLKQTREQLEYEKNINAYTVEQFNKMSIKAKKLQDRVEELESANEALIKHSTPQSLVKAIKATPLPKPIKGDKNV